MPFPRYSPWKERPALQPVAAGQTAELDLVAQLRVEPAVVPRVAACGAVFGDGREERARLDLERRGIARLAARREVRVEEVRVVVLVVHRRDRFAETRLAVEDRMPGVRAAIAVRVAREPPHGTCQVGLRPVLRLVGEARVALSGEKAVLARLGGPLQGFGELRQQAEAGRVRLDVAPIGTVLGLVPADLLLGDVVEVPAERRVRAILVVEARAQFILPVAAHVVAVRLLAVLVFLSERWQPVVVGAEEREGVERAGVVEVRGEPHGIEVGRARTVAAGAVGNDALRAEGHVLAADAQVEEVEKPLLPPVEVVDEDDIREALLAAFRLGAAIMAELVGETRVEPPVFRSDVDPRMNPDARVVRMGVLAALVGREPLRDVVAQAEIRPRLDHALRLVRRAPRDRRGEEGRRRQPQLPPSGGLLLGVLHVFSLLCHVAADYGKSA